MFIVNPLSTRPLAPGVPYNVTIAANNSVGVGEECTMTDFTRELREFVIFVCAFVVINACSDWWLGGLKAGLTINRL